MLRDLHSFSVIAAFCAMAVMVIETLFAGIGWVSILFGGIVFPFAYLFAFTLGLPLLLARRKLKLNIYVWLLVYWVAGLFGAILFLLAMGISIENTVSLASGFVFTYGPMGLAAATGAWYFSVYRNNKSGAPSVHR